MEVTALLKALHTFGIQVAIKHMNVFVWAIYSPLFSFITGLSRESSPDFA
jgi:hypothetical protein